MVSSAQNTWWLQPSITSSQSHTESVGRSKSCRPGLKGEERAKEEPLQINENPLKRKKA